MEIRTVDPEDVKGVATATARSVPADQIDATFKSQYTGTETDLYKPPQALNVATKFRIQTLFPLLSAPRSYPSATNGSLRPRT
jgi:hypothetical protein